MGSTILSVRKVRELGYRTVANLIPPDSLIYFSIDIDGLDPSIAGGTGTPSHGGFSYYEVKDLLRLMVYRSKRLVGMDLVEVSPPYDPNGVTSTLAARLLLDSRRKNTVPVCETIDAHGSSHCYTFDGDHSA